MTEDSSIPRSSAARRLAIFGALITGAAGISMAVYSIVVGEETGAGAIRGGDQVKGNHSQKTLTPCVPLSPTKGEGEWSRSGGTPQTPDNPDKSRVSGQAGTVHPLFRGAY